MRLLHKQTIIISIIFSSYSCYSNLTAQHSSKPIQPLLDSLELIIAEDRIPGAMISIVTADSVIYKGGVGYAAIEDSVAVTEAYLFRLGSISKTITALAIMRLVEQNKVSLKTPIMEIDSSLPIKNKWRDTSPILVEHLLEHTAGFDDIHFHSIYNKTDSIRPSCRDMVDSHAKSLKARWEPGTYMSYSNPGYVVAGHVIEKVSGLPFDEFIKQELLNPIGMTSSDFYFKEPTSFPMTTGYIHEGGKFRSIDFPSIQGGPAGELCSNAEDMTTFLQFMLNSRRFGSENKLISAESLKRMESSHTSLAAKRGLPGGYGLAIGSGWRHGYKTLGHNGGIDGFVSDYMYLPEADFALAVSVNTSRRTHAIVDAILEYYLDAPKVQRTVQPISDEIKKKYEGYYSYLNPRNALFGFLEKMATGVSLTIAEDSIIIKDLIGNEIDIWFHAGDQQFYTRQEGEPFSMLLENNGTEAIWVADAYAEKEFKLMRWIKNILFVLSLISLVLYLLYGFFAFVFQLFSKTKRMEFGRISLWLGSISFIVMAGTFIYGLEFSVDIARPNIFSIITFVSSILFLLTTLLGSISSFRQTEHGPFSRWYFRLTALLMVGLAIYLLTQGIIGIRLWSY